MRWGRDKLAANRVKAPNQFPAFLAMAKYSLKAQLRNRATFFFGFIFPIVFISVFGLIGNSGGFTSKIGFPDTVSQNDSLLVVLKSVPAVRVSQDSLDNLQVTLKKGKLDAILTTSTNATGQTALLVETSAANVQNNPATVALIKGIVDKLNLQLSGIKNPPFTISQKEISGRALRYIDFALPGQIGFALLSTAIFGTVFGLVYLKKAKVIKRIFATPTRALTILTGQGASRLMIALVQAALLIGFGVLVFHFNLINGWVTFGEMMLLSAFGLIAFLGFGLFIAGLSNDENSIAPIINLFTLPQFLLSGTFFPIDSLPNWLQPVANNLPLTYFNAAMRKISTETSDLTQVLPYLLGLAVWSILAYLVTAKTFKWE